MIIVSMAIKSVSPSRHSEVVSYINQTLNLGLVNTRSLHQIQVSQRIIAVLKWKPLTTIKYTKLGFPGGTVVESPPAEAGDTGSCPGPGRSHMPLSGWARESWPLSLRVRGLCAATGEATTVTGPRTAKK